MTLISTVGDDSSLMRSNQIFYEHPYEIFKMNFHKRKLQNVMGLESFSILFIDDLKGTS
jgi:hypothetical protein